MPQPDADTTEPTGVSEGEFEWMLDRRSLEVSEASLSLDYGADAAAAMLSAFAAAGMTQYVGGGRGG